MTLSKKFVKFERHSEKPAYSLLGLRATRGQDMICCGSTSYPWTPSLAHGPEESYKPRKKRIRVVHVRGVKGMRETEFDSLGASRAFHDSSRLSSLRHQFPQTVFYHVTNLANQEAESSDHHGRDV